MSPPVALRAVASWALLAGLLPCVVRAGVLLGFGLARPEAVDVFGSLLRWPGEVLLALPIGWMWMRGMPTRPVAVVAAGLWFGLTVVSAHFEAAFGELPTTRAVAQLQVLRGSGQSLSAAAPPWALAFEWVSALALLWWAAAWIGQTGGARGAPWVASGCVALAACLMAAPDALPRRLGWSVRLPWVHLWGVGPTAEPATPATAAGGGAEDPRGGLRALQRDWGHAVPFASGRSEAPLCAEGPSVVGPRPTRDLVLLVLEGVGHRELGWRLDGRPVMPALARIAGEYFSASHFVASGTQSAQALPSLFAGQPAQTAYKVLLKRPMPVFEGLPSQLARAGVRTAYFHGGDLAFEQQRRFLRAVGFDEMHEYRPDEQQLDVRGWGLPDGEMLARLRTWTDARRGAGERYFAALATLSTHHPFALPPGHTPEFGEDSPERAFASALRYLDAELDAYVRWHLVHAPEAWLVLVGDHAPMLENSVRLVRGQPARTDVAFIVVAPRGVEPGGLSHAAQRLGAQMDVARTLGAMLDQPRLRCDQGLDFFGEASGARSERLVHTVSGRDLNEIYVHHGGGRARLRRRERSLEPLDGATSVAARVSEYLLRVQPISYDLVARGAFAPAPAADVAGALRDARAPLRVSHRGRTAVGDHDADNSLGAIARAIDAGFDRVEIDLQLTADGRAVLAHDPEFVGPGGAPVVIAEHRLEELRALEPHMATLEQALARHADRVHFHIEAKRQTHPELDLALGHAISRAVSARRRSGGMLSVLVDSFDLTIASSVARHCACDVAWDPPHRKPIHPETIEVARGEGLTWIYVHHSVATRKALDLTHEGGLRMMVYTVNDPAELAPLEGRLPDGVITDSATIRLPW